jgi:hypothetical protein
MSMKRWCWTLVPEQIEEELRETPAWNRRALARRYLQLTLTTLDQIPPILRSHRNAFRRAVAALEGRRVAIDEQPGPKPALRRKEKVARRALVAALVFDFFVSLAIAIVVFKLRPLIAIMFGVLFTGALGILAKAVAGILVNYERLQHWVRLLIAVAVGAFVVTVVSVVVLYLARNGVLPLSVLGAVTPALTVTMALLAGSFSALADIYAYPRELFEEVQRLEHFRAELLSLKGQLENVAGDDPDPRAEGLPAESPKRPSGSPRRSNGRWLPGGVASALLIGTLALSVSRTATAEEMTSVRCLQILNDASNTGDQTADAERVVRTVADGLGALTEGLGNPRELVICHFTSAETIWRTGRVFELPRADDYSRVPEANLPGFEFARGIERDRSRLEERERDRPILAQARQALLERPAGPVTRSCTTDALNRAVELPVTNVALVITDGENFLCPTRPSGGSVQAAVAVVLTPRNDGPELHQRMEERRQRIVRGFPGVLVVESYRITGPESLRELGQEIRRLAERRIAR